MIKNTTKKLLSVIISVFLTIMVISSTFGAVVTYNLNGGALPTGETVYQIETNNNSVVLDNPTKTGYIFTGWCDSDHYAKVNNQDTCSTDRVGLETITNDNISKTLVHWTVPNNLATDTTYIAMWEEDKFQATTTNLSVNDTFTFYISAGGTFWIDWGDGNVEYVNRNNVNLDECSGNTITLMMFSHTYTEAGKKVIRLGGLATGYSSVPVNSTLCQTTISFRDNTKLAGISGSLGAIFPTIGGASATVGLDPVDDAATLNAIQPRFYSTFANCSNLIGPIPATLFNGISGAPANDMFDGTFYSCSGLGRDALEDDPSTTDVVENAPKYSIPATLFSGISGTPAEEMFNITFAECSGLTGTIPATLFSGISGEPASNMFRSTFSNCSGLTGTIPATLISYSVATDTTYGASEYMFWGSGLSDNCSNEMDTYYTNSYKVSCIDPDSIVCEANMSLSGTNCVACSGNDCPTVRTLFSCPPGYSANAVHSACITKYTITYVLDDGTVAEPNPSSYTSETNEFTLNNPTKSGYVFLGWCEDADLKVNCELTKTISFGSFGDKTFYAKYGRYTITYELNGAAWGDDEPADFYVPGIGYSSCMMPNLAPGYFWNGWRDENNNWSYCIDISAQDTGDKTFYAQFSLVTLYCNAGQYAYVDGSAVYCKACPDGYYCPGGSDLSVNNQGLYLCSPGAHPACECDLANNYHYDYTQNTCRSCSEGYTWGSNNGRGDCVCNEAGGYKCCISGTYLKYNSDKNSYSCDICSAGSYCAGGAWKESELNGSVGQTPCDINTFTPYGYMGACLPCGDHGHTNTIGSSECICDTGYGWNYKENTCVSTNCSTGYVWDSKEGACICDKDNYTCCEPGAYLYYDSGKDTYYCDKCPAGSYCTGGAWLTLELNGYAVGQTPCAINTVSDYGMSSCLSCGDHGHTNTIGSSECICEDEYKWDSKGYTCICPEGIECAPACDTEEVTILGAPICLIDSDNKTNPALVVRASKGKYYINLTQEVDAENPKHINNESDNVLRIKVYDANNINGVMYNAHDSSVK